jgi:hypothetical protein
MYFVVCLALGAFFIKAGYFSRKEKDSSFNSTRINAVIFGPASIFGALVILWQSCS